MNSKFLVVLAVFLIVFISGCTINPIPPICGDATCDIQGGEKNPDNQYYCPADCEIQVTEIYAAGDVIPNLEGTGSLEGQNVTITFVSVVATSPSAEAYLATFELFDEEGKPFGSITAPSGSRLEFLFLDNNFKPVLKTPLKVVKIYVDAQTLVGYVEIGRGKIPAPYCGDFTCDEGETSATCPEDCGGTSNPETFKDVLFHWTITTTSGLQINVDSIDTDKRVADFMLIYEVDDSQGGGEITSYEIVGVKEGESVKSENGKTEIKLDKITNRTEFEGKEYPAVTFTVITDEKTIVLEGKCGDGICNLNENQYNCPEDCGTITPETIELYSGKGYPYDPNDQTGIYDYTVTITSSGNSLQNIKISNSRDKWNISSSSNGPLYPTTLGQSLTGKPTDKEAIFGNALAEGMAGKGYARVSFAGFKTDWENSTIEIGKVSGLPSDSIGGLKYRSADDASHTIPMAWKVGWSDTPSSFMFDGQVIWYDLNFVTESGSDGSTGSKDLKFILRNDDYLNNRQVKISIPTTISDLTVTITPVDGSAIKVNLGQTFTLDSVTYRLSTFDAKNSFIILAVDGSLELRRQSNTGTQLYNTKGDTTDQTYGKLYFNDDKINENAILMQDSRATSGKGVYYVINPARTLSRFWFMLKAQTFGTGESNVIENGKVLEFKGTAVPTNDTFMEDSRLTGDYYFIPQSTDFNSEARFGSGNAYFVADFKISGLQSGSSYATVYIDGRDGALLGPFPNSNLNYYSNDMFFNGSPSITLTSGSQSNYYQAAYADNGAKAWLNGNDSVIFKIPEKAENVIICVSGPNSTDCKTGSKSYDVPLRSGTGVEVMANDSGDSNTLSDAQLTHLYNKAVIIKVDNNVTTPTLTERIGVKVDAKMDTTQDIKDLVAYVESGDFFYKIKLNGTTGIDLGTTTFTDTGDDDRVIIPFFGTEYELVEANLTGTQYVKLKKA